MQKTQWGAMKTEGTTEMKEGDSTDRSNEQVSMVARSLHHTYQPRNLLHVPPSRTKSRKGPWASPPRRRW